MVSGRTRGPAPQPVELRIMKGNPGKRALPPAPKPKLLRGVPTPPAELGPQGVAAWNRICTAARAWLGESDLMTLHQLCRLTDHAAELERVIARDGLTRESGTGRAALNPLFNDLRGLYRQITDLASVLGFTPSDRSRVKVERSADDPLSAWEQSS